jgi:hypothetical protein
MSSNADRGFRVESNYFFDFVIYSGKNFCDFNIHIRLTLPQFGSRDISVGIVIGLEAGRSTNRGSIHRGNKRFTSSPICPDRLCCQPKLLLKG